MTAEDDTTAQPDHATDRLSLTTLIVFGSISMPISLLAIGMFMFVPRVYSSLGGITMGDAGIIILVTRLWDFVTDPLIGWLSDKTRSRFGRRIPWMVLAWAPLTLAVYKLFLPPPDAGALYLGVWSFVLFSSGTALFMPYTAMGAELSTAYHQRSRVFLYRHLFAVVGTLGAALLFIVANQSGTAFFPERDALELIALVGLLLLPIPIIATALFVRERPVPAMRADPDANWRSGIRLMLANKPYLRILACYFVNGIANAFPVTLLFFYVKQVIERPDWTAIYLAVYFSAAIIGTPIWMFVANRLGKHVAWRYALILAILAFSSVPFLGSGDAIPFLFVAMVAGLTLGADLAMPASMLADVVDQDVLETGKQRTGIFYAVWAMAAKAAAALVVGFSLKLLDVVGFVPDMYNGDDALLVLAILFGVCPIMFKILALSAVWRYPLTAERQAQLRAEILERRAA
ncbi:MAG: MFS transporter [Rhodospirillaceae bacterium]|jgi:Na+/melibiose symporter-like transporter|nr:MFS transporter [Rhodospirillaceae bacterium]MBT4771225.1 MFS transporter [Rhodospirillaceae bacterium]MBT5357069.1 MFS transporter [Rhodospirillaceae bacterium]MBT5769229.1 MFS transporter [Rhodospirillaceae bacterium]MBT6308827.1 MFS transporter [Rhodospirillaceae bacterium]